MRSIAVGAGSLARTALYDAQLPLVANNWLALDDPPSRHLVCGKAAFPDHYGGISGGPHSATSWVNMIGVPAVVVPAGFYPTGLPFGLEFAGRRSTPAASSADYGPAPPK